MNYGGLLPKTGTASLAVAVGGTTFHAPMPLVIAAAGIAFIAMGAAAVRVGFRRKKAVGQA